MRSRPGHSEITDTIHSGDADDLCEILHNILKTILQLPWLNTNAGGIFLADPENQKLSLAARVNFSRFLNNRCSGVEYGHCLCGRVAESSTLLQVASMDERHEIQYDGMCDHGHYVTSITLNNQFLGVMILYIDAGHEYTPDETSVLENFTDIVALQIHTAQIRQEKQLSDLILAHSSHGVIITDQKLNIRWVNQAFQDISGYSMDETLGKSPAILSSGRHGPEFYATMWQSINKHGFWEGEIWNRNKNGGIYPEWLSIVALKNKHGEVLRYAGMFVDLSGIKAAEEKIHHLAYYDDVTGLPNATLLHKNLKKMLATLTQKNHRVIVATLNLDHFHEINTGLGRRVGDLVLREVMHRICAMLDDAVVARPGTDEFVVAHLVQHEDDGTIQVIVDKLARTFKEHFQRTFKTEHHELNLECSIGIAWGNNHNSDAESLLRRSAIALAHCKKHSRGEYQVHNREMEREADYQRFLGVAIGKAIERDELFLVYQPQVDCEGRVIGAEVLLRWHNQEYGNIPPDVFIGIAEERGDIIDIGRWVLERTLEQVVQWRKAGLYDTDCFQRLAINVSPHQILSKSIAQEFARACAAHGLRPEAIELEVTETGIMQYSDHVIEHLHELSGLGFKIAIDDFGTGHSSLSRLHYFPVNILKIDRSFVSNMATNTSDAILVKSIIDMAHTLGFQTIAEGVEDAAQLAMLTDYGCAIFQGYYFSKPLLADDFFKFTMQSPLRITGNNTL